MKDPITTILFVRHAQSLHPFSDDRTRPLTEAGLLDRSVVSEVLKDRRIDAFVSSPFKRSIDTISPLAKERNLEITTDERFRERKFGSHSYDFREKRWADFSAAEEGGETLSSVQERNMEALFEVLEKYSGKTVVIGTHGTALSTILNYFDPTFGLEDFYRICNWMPYVIELVFEGKTLLKKEELAHVEKAYQKIDFSKITACGETCTRCEKKKDGRCPGCIEADGVVPEWKESGRCRIHACAHDHGVAICGLCELFPCENVTKLIPWNPNALKHLTYLRDEYGKLGKK
ncbi:MAG: histidine phosphatase family protein [Clostridiales bacterium]|nr:histidine phosphatase family protein [Clostridiales bacterium]